MNRVPEVLDCWFESGSMPYGYLHYPFENREKFERVFPADFIAEALDQTRGWFYTLLVLSTALFKRAPFRNVIVSGMILAEDGRKMSKSLANYPDPMGVMEEYGADALRLYMVTSPVVRGEPLRFSEAGVKDIVRSVLLPYWNAYSFLTTYGEVDKYQPSPGLFDEQDSSAALGEVVSHNILDAWIVSRFQSLLADIEREMGEYRLYNVTPALLVFLEDLTNWYVRRSRRRFWSDNAIDKQAGYDTLFWVLLNFTKVLAPFTPFITEEVYRNLASLVPNAPESVHLCDYPCTAPALISSELEGGMALIQRAVELGRSLRTRLTLRILIIIVLYTLTKICQSPGKRKRGIRIVIKKYPVDR
jgi:isoleucyl-tRNA synthetase